MQVIYYSVYISHKRLDTVHKIKYVEFINMSRSKVYIHLILNCVWLPGWSTAVFLR